MHITKTPKLVLSFTHGNVPVLVVVVAPPPVVIVDVAFVIISLGLSSPSVKELLKKWGSLLVPHVFLWSSFANDIRSSRRNSWILTRSVNSKFVGNKERREERKGRKDGRKNKKEGRSRSFFLSACLMYRCRLGIIGGRWRDAQCYYCCCCCFCYLQNQQQQRLERRRSRSMCVCLRKREINTKYAE